MATSKWEKFLRKLAYAFLILTNAMAFLPSLSSVYLYYGRYSIYIALLLGAIATVLSFKAALKKGGAYTHIWVIIKLLVLAGILYISYFIYAMNYGGV